MAADVVLSVDGCTVPVVVNAYGDWQVGEGEWPGWSPDAFRRLVVDIIAKQAPRGVWLTLPCDVQHMPLVAAAVEAGYTCHHAYGGVLTLQAWYRTSPTMPGRLAPNPTPPYGHHALGASAIVVRARDGHILAIRDRYDASGLWKTPGGHVDEGEGAVAAAVREAWEETGVRCEPVGVVAWLELQLGLPEGLPAAIASTPAVVAKVAQNTRFGTTHLSAWVVCLAHDDAIHVDPDEVAHAAWMPAEEVIQGAPDHIAFLLQCMTMAHPATGPSLHTRLLGHATTTAGPHAPFHLPLPMLHGIELRTRHRKWPDAMVKTNLYTAFPPPLTIAAAATIPNVLGIRMLSDPDPALKPLEGVPVGGCGRGGGTVSTVTPWMPLAAATLAAVALAVGVWLGRRGKMLPSRPS